MMTTLDVRIDSIAAGGDGVGRHHGLVVFSPRTAPGDLVRVEGERRDRFMRGKLLEVLVASDQRVEPPCVHYARDRCGGCQVQHIEYGAQLDAKSGIIRDAMTRIGRTEVEKPVVEPSEQPWRYRRKLTLALRRRGSRWIAGLHRYDEPHEVFELQDCPITDETVVQGWRLVLAQQQFLPEARELRGAVRLLRTGFSFTLEGAHAWRTHEQIFAAIPQLRELWWKPEEQQRQLVQTRATEDEAGASFTQVNSGVAMKLRECVVGLAMRSQPRTVVDAYSGTGDIAVALAAQGATVTAIEIDPDAARVCSRRLPAGSRAVTAAVEKTLPDFMPADVVILNPPRAGLDARVTEYLSGERGACGTVIYVSCDPATLARDVRRMTTFRVHSLRAFDMFPQTAHVETVCELVPAA